LQASVTLLTVNVLTERVTPPVQVVVAVTALPALGVATKVVDSPDKTVLTAGVTEPDAAPMSSELAETSNPVSISLILKVRVSPFTRPASFIATGR
jgi:hypothetical protein